MTRLGLKIEAERSDPPLARQSGRRFVLATGCHSFLVVEQSQEGVRMQNGRAGRIVKLFRARPVFSP